MWSEVQLVIRRGGLVPKVDIYDPNHPLFEAQLRGVTQEYWHTFVSELMPQVAADFGI